MQGDDDIAVENGDLGCEHPVAAAVELPEFVVVGSGDPDGRACFTVSMNIPGGSTRAATRLFTST
jgi:hypothetical protein